MTLLTAVRTEYKTLVAPKQISHRPDLAGRQHIYSSVDYGQPQANPVGDTYLDYATLYTVHPWVHKAIQKISDQIAPLNIRVLNAEDKEQTGHPVAELFGYINDTVSPSLFWNQYSIHMLLGGETLFDLGMENKPTELWQWQPDRFLVHPDQSQPRYPRVAGYTVTGEDGDDQFLDYTQAIHVKFYNPLNSWRGIGPITAIREGVTIDLFAQMWSKRFLKNSARPDFAIVAPQGLTATERDRYLADFMHQHQGADRAHLPVILEDGMTDIKPFSWAPKDIEWLQQREFSRDEVGAIFGVPDEIMGYGRDTYENFETALKVFWVLTCKPFIDHRDSVLTRFFSKVRPMLRPGERIDTDTSEVSALQDDILPKVQAAYTLWAMGVPFNTLDDRLGLGIGEIRDDGRRPPTDEAPEDEVPGEDEIPAKSWSTKAALVAATKQVHTSAMVAFFMPPSLVSFLVRLQGYLPIASTPVPVGELHMTLMLLGDAGALESKRHAITETLQSFAGVMSPIRGRLNGIGRFQNVETGVDAMYVSFDSKALSAWRQELVNVLRLAGVETPSEHGFIPHITLGYVPHDAPTPWVDLPVNTESFDSVWLAWGDERQVFPLAVNDNEEGGTVQRFFTRWTGKITPERYKALILQLDPSDDEAEQVVRMALEQRSERSIRRALNSLLDTLFPEGWGDFVDPQLEADRIHRRFLADQQLRDAVSRALQDGVDLGVSVAVDQLGRVGIGLDYTLPHVAAREWALRYTDELLVQMGATTRAGVGQAIARWVDNGEPLQALISDLQPFFGPRRAELIASTEVTRAYAQGSVEAYRASGVVKEQEWRTANDEIVRQCPYCAPMHGRRAPLGQAWQHPSFGPIEIPAHPRCRCWVTGVVET